MEKIVSYEWRISIYIHHNTNNYKEKNKTFLAEKKLST